MIGREGRRHAANGEGERLADRLPAQCLGQKCLNFSGTECVSHLELLVAPGDSGGEDLPPLKDEPPYAIYGQVCNRPEYPSLAAQVAQVLKAGVNPAEIVAVSRTFGDMPLTILAPGQEITMETIAQARSDQQE